MATGGLDSSAAPQMTAMTLDKLKIEIRSILITAKGGSSIHDLQRDFQDVNGRQIPAAELGFRSVQDLLSALSDVVVIRRGPDGSPKLFAKSHETTRRIEKLIARQKTPRVTRFGGTEQSQQQAAGRRSACNRRNRTGIRFINRGGGCRIVQDRRDEPRHFPNGAVNNGNMQPPLEQPPRFQINTTCGLGRGRGLLINPPGSFSNYKAPPAPGVGRGNGLIWQNLIERTLFENRQNMQISPMGGRTSPGGIRTLSVNVPVFPPGQRSVEMVREDRRLQSTTSLAPVQEGGIQTLSVNLPMFPPGQRSVEVVREDHRLRSTTSLAPVQEQRSPPQANGITRAPTPVAYQNHHGQNGSISPPISLRDDVSNADATLPLISIMDRVWLVAMKSHDQRLLITQVRNAYKTIWGTEFPVKDLDHFSIQLFDFTDRFDFTYEGVLEIIAASNYEPSDSLVIEKLALARNIATRNFERAGSDSDHVSLGELFTVQQLPVPLDQLDELSEGDPARCLEVLIAQVDTPSRFFVHLKSTHDQLEDLTKEMSDYYSDSWWCVVAIPANDIHKGTICACRFDDDQLWCRGIVHDVEPDGIKVLLVDYGTEIMVCPGEIYYLPHRFFALPAQAIECGLAFLSPPGETWPVEAGEVLADTCGTSVLWAELYAVKNGVPQIFLSMKYENGEELWISDGLLESNLAIFDESAVPETLINGERGVLE